MSYTALTMMLAGVSCFTLTGAETMVDAADVATPAPTAQRAVKKPQDQAMAKVVDDPTLPRVLLLGDSISIGYTVPVRQQMQGKANVHRALANCGPTTLGVKQIDAWLGEGKWDVIHFNWGLHDLKYCDDKGTLTAIADGHQQVPVDEYEKNLRSLVARLKQTGAKLVFATTTPVPEGAKGRVVADAAKYNAVAESIMKEHGIAIDDLYTFANGQLDKIQKSKDVHFTPAGSEALGAEVVKSIEALLPKK
ncbi:MAG: SGNH/GDSL hydrolase family protein [Planctomycetaceae bacterium]